MIEAIVKWTLVEWTFGLAILDNKMRRVQFKENRIIKNKLMNRKKIFAYVRDIK